MLSTDYCPGANRWVYWLKSPLAVVLLAVAASAVCGVFLNPWIFALTAFLLVVAVIGMALPWLSIKAIHCDVVFDVRRVSFGQPAQVRLRIRNRWPLPVLGLSLIDGFHTSGSTESPTETAAGIAFKRVPALSEIEYSWPFVARRRGQYPLMQTANVETSFPFGLMRARKTAEVTGSLLVWPETTNLDGLPDASESEFLNDVFSERRVGEYGDTVGTRPFREGDSLRRVHWSQTARHQNLIVTERQAPITSVARIIVDLAAQHHPAQTRDQTVEQCVRIAASLCQSLHQQHCQIELQIGDELFQGTSGKSGLNRIMDALAVAQILPDDKQVPAARTVRSFQVEITTTLGTRPDARQIVVATNDQQSAAWIGFRSDQPISDLADLYQRGLS